MSAALVRRALETALNTWASTNSVQVAWENVEYTPTPGTIYARAHLLPATTITDGLAMTHRGYRGVFQVTLYTPQGTGSAAAHSLAALLDVAFTTAQPLSAAGLSVYISRPMTARVAQFDGGAYVVPVDCEYIAHTVP